MPLYLPLEKTYKYVWQVVSRLQVNDAPPWTPDTMSIETLNQQELADWWEPLRNALPGHTVCVLLVAKTRKTKDGRETRLHLQAGDAGCLFSSNWRRHVVWHAGETEGSSILLHRGRVRKAARIDITDSLLDHFESILNLHPPDGSHNPRVQLFADLPNVSLVAVVWHDRPRELNAVWRTINVPGPLDNLLPNEVLEFFVGTEWEASRELQDEHLRYAVYRDSIAVAQQRESLLRALAADPDQLMVGAVKQIINQRKLSGMQGTRLSPET